MRESEEQKALQVSLAHKKRNLIKNALDQELDTKTATEESRNEDKKVENLFSSCWTRASRKPVFRVPFFDKELWREKNSNEEISSQEVLSRNTT